MSQLAAYTPLVTSSDNTRRKLDTLCFTCPKKAPVDGSSCVNILPNGILFEEIITKARNTQYCTIIA